MTDLGRLAYAQALEVQRSVHARVLAGAAPPTLLLVEHDPVITVSRRTDASRHILADRGRLAQLGIDVQPTDRGGDVTYHGPGQLVAYPILPLASLHLNVSQYMRRLEQIVIDTLATFDIAAHRIDGCTGVWVDGQSPAKIGALGVRIKRNVSMHGLAVNVTTNLDHFTAIVPCGLTNRTVTSMKQLLGDACPTMSRVKQELIAQVRRAIAY